MNHRDEFDEGVKDARTDRANNKRRPINKLGYNPSYIEGYESERNKPIEKESK